MRVHEVHLKSGISRTKAFERKRLASYAVNRGTMCGHGCLYCSTGAMMRMPRSFKETGEDPFGTGFAIIDPDTPLRVARDALRKRERGLVQISTIVDAWSPEAQALNLGRRCLEVILSQPGWTVRILTKNAAVVLDFDLIKQHADRVLVSLSLTAAPAKEKLASVIEPHASTISERMAALGDAHRQGLRTYGMLCPLMPGIADSQEDIDELVRFVVECGAEEIFAEALNSRGPGLKRMQEALVLAGYEHEAAVVGSIRNRATWFKYVVRLLATVQGSVRRLYDIQKLRFLLYPSRLLPEHVAEIRKDDAGVIWLGKEERHGS